MAGLIENIVYIPRNFVNSFPFVSRETSRPVGAQSSFELFVGPEITRSPNAIPQPIMVGDEILYCLFSIGLLVDALVVRSARRYGNSVVPLRIPVIGLIVGLIALSGALPLVMRHVSRETP